jgi:hypothetical protein
MGANALQQGGEHSLGRQQAQQQFLDDAEDAATGTFPNHSLVAASDVQRPTKFLDADIISECRSQHPVSAGSNASFDSLGRHVAHRTSDWLSSNLYSHSRQPSALSSVVPSLHPHQRPVVQASVIAAHRVAQKMPLITNQDSIAAAIKALQL